MGGPLGRGCACATENGRIITDRDYYDQLELYCQLGSHLEPDLAA
ncbi:hypothetical protein [Microtetraspora glauca]|uniref:Nuclear transport factor 2 family protein n=1 Tax=Microtetraspora glauca TaxID=1996 RepID=A0ABV3GQW9_MICGL